MVMLFGKQRRQKKPELQRRASDESNSSSTTTSPSKTHRRTSSFNGWTSIGPYGSDSDVSVKSFTANATDPLNVSWSSSGSGSLQVEVEMDYSPESAESKSGSKHNLADDGDNKSVCALELIRQLSFSCSPPKTKKRTDIASPKKHGTSPIGLDLKYLQELRNDSPSPLVGLQYLPDGNIFI